MRGQFKSTMNAKGVMNFPIKLREELGSSFIISKTLDEKCIKVYSNEDWSKLVETIKAMPQTETADIQRFLFASAFEVEPDKQGRILIPAPLRLYANLTSEIVIVGLEGRAEIWDKDSWEQNNAMLDMANLKEIAIALGL